MLNISHRCNRYSRLCSALVPLWLFFNALCASGQVPGNDHFTNAVSETWVAFNDDTQGTESHPFATFYTAPAYGTGSGSLLDIETGTVLPVHLTITNNPGVNRTTGVKPAPGTPAYNMFNGYIDWANNPNNGLVFYSSNMVGYLFTGLDPEKLYRFTGTAVRGDSASTNRWTKVELVGALSYTPVHSSRVITSAQFPADLSGSQAAYNSGANHTAQTGDIIDYNNIVPAPDGTFTILCSKYSGSIPGGFLADGRAGYAFSALRLQQVLPEPALLISSPANGGSFAAPTSLTITAMPYGLNLPTNVQFYANGVLLGTSETLPFSMVWSNPAIGDWQLTAIGWGRGSAVTSPVVNITITAAPPAQLVNGPYVQISTPSSMRVHWRTSPACDSRVRFGTNATNLQWQVQDTRLVTEHELLLSNLQPETRYYYAVGSTSQTLTEGTNVFFQTAPVGARPTRIWVTGDTRTGDPNQRAVYDTYLALTGTNYTHVWLMMGDNGGPTGTDQEFQVNFFDMYTEILPQTVSYPCIGNHDAYTQNAQPYLDLFSLPTGGEAGGVPSGTERYYSFNYASIHFVALDSVTSDVSTDGAMYRWLEQDLAANTNDWLIVYWHYPPYSHGSHSSDNEYGMILMRQNFGPLVEAYGADLVLGGHSHAYERSYLLDRHYGTSSTLTSAMVLDAGNGRTNGTGAYRKPALGPNPHQGAVYVVAGSAGLLTCGTLDHPAMYYSTCSMGSMVIDINSNRLDAIYLRDTGAIDDYFTIIKGSVLRISSIRRQSGAVVLTWAATPGQFYRVSRKASLESAWENISPVLQSDGQSYTWADDAPLPSTAFYRIEQVNNSGSAQR